MTHNKEKIWSFPVLITILSFLHGRWFKNILQVAQYNAICNYQDTFPLYLTIVVGGAWKCKFLTILGNHDRQTGRPTIQPTCRSTDQQTDRLGHMNVHFQGANTFEPRATKEVKQTEQVQLPHEPSWLSFGRLGGL